MSAKQEPNTSHGTQENVALHNVGLSQLSSMAIAESCEKLVREFVEGIGALLH